MFDLINICLVTVLLFLVHCLLDQTFRKELSYLARTTAIMQLYSSLYRGTCSVGKNYGTLQTVNPPTKTQIGPIRANRTIGDSTLLSARGITYAAIELLPEPSIEDRSVWEKAVSTRVTVLSS